MEQGLPIVRSSEGLRAKIISLGILALVISISLTFIILLLFRLVDNTGIAIVVFTWVILTGAWGLGSLKIWEDWSTEHYELTPDSIIIHKKENNEDISQSIYRYESVISLRLIQSKKGKKHNFGDVYLTIPKISKELVLKDIVDPLDQLAVLKKHIDSRQGNHSLIT